MTTAAIAAALSLVESLVTLIPQWIAAAKAKGELTVLEEAAFQRRQAAVFAAPYAQPENRYGTALKQVLGDPPLPDVTKPNV